MIRKAHVVIHGDVFGVGFRAWTVRNAKELGLVGWVQNAEAVYPERSRRVEAVFEGEKKDIEAMIAQCKKGPEVAWVEKVEVKWEDPTGEFSGFEIRY